MEGIKEIVLVDDDENLLEILTYWFRAKKLTVHDFNTGTKGLDYLLKKENMDKTSLIVLDRMLPDMDGIDIIRKLVGAYKKERAPILFLSTLSTNNDVLRGLNEGAIDYIGKPFNRDVFLAKAVRLMG